MSAVEQAAKVIADFEACGYCEGECSECRGTAQALADAGLLVTEEHDRKIKTAAWDEGHLAGLRTTLPYAHTFDLTNPYRKENGHD